MDFREGDTHSCELESAVLLEEESELLFRIQR